ncbi:MAG: hypothetical protein WAM14_04210, partial [Candidatus Nitrosopolaris sp.]
KTISHDGTSFYQPCLEVQHSGIIAMHVYVYPFGHCLGMYLSNIAIPSMALKGGILCLVSFPSHHPIKAYFSILISSMAFRNTCCENSCLISFNVCIKGGRRNAIVYL